jgi:hypothetical protein
MKKIKQLSIAIMFFSVLALSYLVISVSAQGGAGMNGGECDPNPACVENCCDQCDPNPACVENCCPAEDPNDPNNVPGSSGSSDTATFDPNTGLDSQAPRNNVIRKPKGTIPLIPTGKITRNPRDTITSKPTGRISRNSQGNVPRNPSGTNESLLTPSALGHRTLCDRLRAEVIEAFDEFNRFWERGYSRAHQTYRLPNGDEMDTSGHVFTTNMHLLGTHPAFIEFTDVMAELRRQNINSDGTYRCNRGD